MPTEAFQMDGMEMKFWFGRQVLRVRKETEKKETKQDQREWIINKNTNGADWKEENKKRKRNVKGQWKMNNESRTHKKKSRNLVLAPWTTGTKV
ncbi:hypothetical protein RUM43_012796 [Polyplax serrata]|uniref:Uncharacterized protein n=1 Tax=Polyplax serrata TaxID=468196 RepID=A0AAN8P642_POLSC